MVLGYDLRRGTEWIDETAPGIWRYQELLPLKTKDWVTLYEGRTPLYQLDCNGIAVYIKDETRNPTGSFKDRPVAVAVSVAKELGAPGILVASSGNAGAAVAAYAAKAGLKAIVLVPEEVPTSKLIQICAYGAFILRVAGDYSNSFRLARELGERLGWANVTSTYLNPFALEGNKTIAHELYEQLHGKVPDWILVPVGAGALVSGIVKGYKELSELNEVEQLPRMGAIQSTGCAPIVRAFESGQSGVKAWDSPTGIASGILDPLRGYEQDGTQTLRMVYETHGVAVAIDDMSVLEGIKELGRHGIFAEPAGAIAYSAVTVLQSAGKIAAGDSVVVIVTGSGFKNIGPISALFEETPIVAPSCEEALRVLERKGVIL